jgi:hypothetical protein
MRDKTQVQIWHAGDKVVSTVHHIDAEGNETSEVLSASEPLELELEETAKARTVVKGERVYDWQR